MLRVVVADDSVLLREGLIRLLAENGHDVVAAVGDGPSLVRGHRAAHARTSRWWTSGCRRRTPTRACAPRSRPASGSPAPRCWCCPSTSRCPTPTTCWPTGPAAVGYLLKDRVAAVAEFLDALDRVASGGTVLDPEVVAQLLVRRRRDDPLTELTPREREVLALMAEGRSNANIARTLVIADGAVEKHVRNIFTKLDAAARPRAAPPGARGLGLPEQLAGERHRRLNDARRRRCSDSGLLPQQVEHASSGVSARHIARWRTAISVAGAAGHMGQLPA